MADIHRCHSVGSFGSRDGYTETFKDQREIKSMLATSAENPTLKYHQLSTNTSSVVDVSRTAQFTGSFSLLMSALMSRCRPSDRVSRPVSNVSKGCLFEWR